MASVDSGRAIVDRLRQAALAGQDAVNALAVQNGKLSFDGGSTWHELSTPVPLWYNDEEKTFSLGQLWLCVRFPATFDYIQGGRQYNVKTIISNERPKVANAIKKEPPAQAATSRGASSSATATSSSLSSAAATPAVDAVTRTPRDSAATSRGSSSTTGVGNAGTSTSTAKGGSSSSTAHHPSSTSKRARTNDGGSLDEDNKATGANNNHNSSSNIGLDAVKLVMSKEVQYFNRNSALNTTRTLQEVIDIDQKSKTVEEERGRKERRAKSMGSPIIIVPPSASATLNLFNVKSFLEDQKYMTPEEARAAHPDEAKPNSVTIVRRHPQAGEVRYKVVDSPLALHESHWDRVVAVVVSGAAWQFKGWKWNDTAEIFHRCRGIYVFFDDMKLPQQVRAWNVATFPIKRQSRNKDVMQSHAIWEAIDLHMVGRHQPLLQSLLDEAEVRAKSEREARLKGMQAERDDEEDDGAEEEDLNHTNDEALGQSNELGSASALDSSLMMD